MASLTDERRVRWLARLILFLLLLYVFLAAVELLGVSVKTVGKDTAESLFSGLANPFAGLAVGVLATVLWQSSSATTSIVVVMVGSGELSLEYAVPVVMGANIGTSITNTLVSLGHLRRDAEFQRAFSGATVHDMFNLLTVLILFPLELGTGFLQNTARWLVAVLPVGGAGVQFKSPIKTAVKLPAEWIHSGLEDALGLDGVPLAVVLVALALVMLFGALLLITRNMRALMADRIEQWLNRVLRRSGLLGLAIGAVITAAVQSSSITTSLLVPMFGAGVLTLEAGFPIMLGANIGTTVTALLAATVTGPAGLTIAVVHLLFNLSGTLLFFPIKFMRRIPIFLSEKLAEAATRNRVWVLVYIVGVFVVVPLLGILIWKQ